MLVPFSNLETQPQFNGMVKHAFAVRTNQSVNKEPTCFFPKLTAAFACSVVTFPSFQVGANFCFESKVLLPATSNICFLKLAQYFMFR